MTADGLRIAFQKIKVQVLKQIAPDRGPISVGDLKINVGPVKKILTQVLLQGGLTTSPGLDRRVWAEDEAFVAAGQIGDLIVRGLNRLDASTDRAVLIAGVNDLFEKLAVRAEIFMRKTLEAAWSNRSGQGETT